MQTDSGRDSGSLVLRVWVERGADSPFRARILTATRDEVHQDFYADSIPAICDFITEWIDELTETSNGP